MEILVLYASMRGHTAALGREIAEGAEQVPGAHVVVKPVEETDPSELRDADALIWGSSGYFGLPNPKMSQFLANLGDLWFSGALQGKVGGVFATTATDQWGLESVLLSLQVPMLHMGLTVVPNTGQITDDRMRYACPYGASAAIPTEASPDAPMNRPKEVELKMARDYGRTVAEIAAKMTGAYVPEPVRADYEEHRAPH